MRKLSQTAVCNIRHAITVENRSASEVARKYSVSPSTVRAVARGDRYSDIPTAKPIPNFESYLAYPNGKVWSTSRNQFIKAAKKGSSNKKYYNLKNNGNRLSVSTTSIISEVFG